MKKFRHLPHFSDKTLAEKISLQRLILAHDFSKLKSLSRIDILSLNLPYFQLADADNDSRVDLAQMIWTFD